MYSAVKVNGQKLCDLARRGKAVERPARDITVHAIDLLEFDEHAQKGMLRLTVSKGTYVRTLINDLGEALWYAGGHAQPDAHPIGAYTLRECRGFQPVERAAADGAAQTLCYRPTACSPASGCAADGRGRGNASRAARWYSRAWRRGCPKQRARCAKPRVPRGAFFDARR